ncbi:substrate-binding domain-containing protein [Amycolatopsis acidicola]|uniref:Substrate-binding domain-containing protein n=1 Tax=Amycolatopsis acidicola TaxID=2596893 RepID=A0A5N0UQD3_9PSEU|nr:sugar ABC transporter substrate-binding protein [Amycolatopsis acidicola]KAA9149456.1 substrate-binding domain-containing protein [Amycolatopsis acidicola]
MSDEKAATSRRAALKFLGAGGGAVAASALLTACNGAQPQSSGGGAGAFPSTPAWRFTFINHVTTNSFFVPTKTGMTDAAKLLGLPDPQWTGSTEGNVSEMANAFSTAVNGNVDGIAIALTDNNAFVEPTKAALAKGIPVIAYNATAPGNYPLTYVGQDLYTSGFQMGQRIAKDITSGLILVGISQPGGNNVQPRLNGITDALKQVAPGVTVQSVNTGAEQANELNAITAAYDGHTDAKGLYAVDAGSTASIAQLISNRALQGKIHAGGYDTLSDTLKGVQSGALDFTIDQSAYLQGFLPVLYMYLYRLSGTLVSPPVTDTGLTFVTKDNVGPYVSANSKFEGGSNTALIDMPKSIPLPAATA